MGHDWSDRFPRILLRLSKVAPTQVSHYITKYPSGADKPLTTLCGDAPTEASTLADTSLSTIYRDYIDCLNKQDWAELKHFVHNEVHYNGEQIGLPGYRKMLERDFREIPDLHFDIHLLICEPPLIASRLRFNCTPTGRFLGLEVNGRKVSFAENVFYEFDHWKVRLVWSVIDKAAIEAQLQRRECSFGKYTQSQPSASYPT
jgi:predicted ester cyclase